MKKINTLFSILIASLIVVTSCTSPSEGVEVKSNKEVVELLKTDNVMMIDVREPDELEKLAYDVKGIVNIPLSEFEEHLSEIPKDKTIIVACRSGKRSLKAANILAANNFPHIINMEGGIIGWKEAGNGVTSSKSCCSDPNSKKCNPDGTCKK